MSFTSLGGVVRRQWFIVAAVFVIFALVFAVVQPVLKKYTATATVLAVSYPSTDSSVLDPTKDPSAGAVSPGDLATLLTTGVVLRRIAADIGVPVASAPSLAGKITAKVGVGSNLIPVAFTDKHPELAVEGANAAVKELSNYDRQITTARYDRLLSDLASQLSAQRSRLETTDDRIATLTTNDVYATLDGGTGAVNSRLITLLAQRDQLSATLASDAAASKVADQRPQLSAALAPKEIQAQSPAITALQQQYGKDLASYNVMKAGYTANFPGLVPVGDSLRAEFHSMSREIAATTSDPRQSATYVASLLDANKAQGALAGDRSAVAAVDRQIRDLTGRLNGTSSEGAELASLRRERAAEEATFAALSESASKASTDRAQAEEIDSVVPVDHATEAVQSVFSRTPVLGTAMFVLALWLALSLAFLVDSNDRRLRSVDSIEGLYGKPVYAPVG